MLQSTVPHTHTSGGHDPAASRWRMLALLFACRASLGLQFQTLASTADPLVAQFGIGFAQIGTLIGLFMLPGLFLSLPAGWAGRYASDRKLLSLGLATMALGGLIAASAHGFGQLALARVASSAVSLQSTNSAKPEIRGRHPMGRAMPSTVS